MKKYISAILLLVVINFTLTACVSNLKTPINGTYKSDGVLSPQTWTFGGKDEITIYREDGVVISQGTYVISGDEFIVTSLLSDEKIKTNYAITEIKSKSFYINGTEYIKQ